MHKRDRHAILLSLISSEPIRSQAVLASRLTEVGISVTQASVSRDLDELGVLKKNGQYSLPPKARGIAEFGAVAFDVAGANLIVGKCSSGLASAITVRIDAEKSQEIVGTIAGDDTIFIAVKNITDQDAVLRKLGEMFG
ncbi:MAG: hypothetical protein IPG67_15750 [Acidobacteria bacterium]|nr:hypothetical protein [Acidobacteriota bacterium]